MKRIIPNYDPEYIEYPTEYHKRLFVKQIALNGGKIDMPSYWIPEWSILHEMFRLRDERIEIEPETPYNPLRVKLTSIYTKKKTLKCMLKE